MHFICIYHISQGLNFKNIFEFFMTKLLLKEQTYAFLKISFFGHILVNFCPILKIFGTVTIRKTRSLRDLVFWPYLGQFLSDFENLWYRYDQKNEIFKRSRFLAISWSIFVRF